MSTRTLKVTITVESPAGDSDNLITAGHYAHQLDKLVRTYSDDGWSIEEHATVSTAVEIEQQR